MPARRARLAVAVLLLATAVPVAAWVASPAGSAAAQVDPACRNPGSNAPVCRTTPPPTSTPPPPTTTPPPADGGCPAYPAFPDGACTGWAHTGVTLRRVPADVSSGLGWVYDEFGDVKVETDGATLDGLDMPCTKVLAAVGVTITRSRIRCSADYSLRTTGSSGLTLADVEIDGLDSAATPVIAVMATPDSTFTRLDVHGMGSSGPRLASGEKLGDSWVHGFVCTAPDHSAGVSANDGGSGIVLEHNTIDIATSAAGCATAAWELATDCVDCFDGVTVAHNRFDGGNYCAYTGVSPGGARNTHYDGNVFGRRYFPECGNTGPAVQWAAADGNTWTGNTWGDGAAATSAHAVGDPVIP